MMPVKQTFDSSGAGNPIALDYMPLSKITAAVSQPGGGSLAVEVQVTLDDINEIGLAATSWFNVILAPTSAVGFINFDGPWRFIRLNVGALTSPIIFQVAQAVTPRA